MVEDHYRSIHKVLTHQNIPAQDFESKSPKQNTEANSSATSNILLTGNNFQQPSANQNELLISNKKFQSRKRQSNEISEEVIEKKKQLIGQFCYYLNYNTKDYQKCNVVNYNSDIKKFRIVTANKLTMHVSPNVLCSQSEFTKFLES